MISSNLINKLHNEVQKRLIKFLNINFPNFPILYLFRIKKRYLFTLPFIKLMELSIITDDIENMDESLYYLIIEDKIPKYRFLILTFLGKEFTIELRKKGLTYDFIFTSFLLNKGVYINKSDEYIKIDTLDKFIHIIPLNRIKKITISQSAENKNHVNLVFTLSEKEILSVSLNIPQEKIIMDKFTQFLYKNIF